MEYKTIRAISNDDLQRQLLNLGAAWEPEGEPTVVASPGGQPPFWLYQLVVKE
jgi:hypothetical protein